MAKIKNLNTLETKPQDDVVTALERMLEKAKAGKIYSVLIIAEDRTGAVDYGRAIAQKSALRLVGALEMLKNQLISTQLVDVPNAEFPDV